MTIILDGTLTDWSPDDRLERPETLVDGYALFGRYEDGAYLIALESAEPIGPNTTFWLNTDADSETGHKVWDWAVGAEFNINFGTDGIARLYSGSEGATLVAEIEYLLGAGGTILEMKLPQALVGLAVTSLTVYADINNSVFLPSSYAEGGYLVTQPSSSSFDGLLAEWTEEQRLDTQLGVVDGYAMYGRVESDEVVFALSSAQPIGPGSTFWLNTDGNTATGHQIFGWAAGAEFNVNIDGDGIARLYSGAAGEIFVSDVDFALAPNGMSIEFSVSKQTLGFDQSVQILADINDSVFLPANYGTGGYTLVEEPASSFDGVLSEWTEDERLDTQLGGVDGYAMYGRVDPDQVVFALSSAQPIGPGSTFWLNTDGNTATGHQVFGWAAGAEFNVNIDSNGIARLYSGAAGETFVSDIDFAISADGLSIEFSVPKQTLGFEQSVQILADINDSVFLPANYGTGGYLLIETPSSSFDGLLTEWTPDQRLEGEGTGIAGYELYGRVDSEQFVVALKSAQPIGPNTTFWINTDGSSGTGHQIWGWAGGAEFNVNIGADGIARLYSGAAGEIFVADLDHAFGADGTTLEFALPKDLLGTGIEEIAVLSDVNDTVFLPNNYGYGGYTIGLPPVSAFDGILSEWTQSQRIETPTTLIEGYELFGTVANDAFVVALKSAVEIGPNTTFWINTDGNTSTGHLVWGWAVGAEFNVNIDNDGRARLYTGNAGETLVAEIDFALGPDGKSIELAIPKSLLGTELNKIGLMADVNDVVHLPADYTQPAYTITDPASLPPLASANYKIAIVYSQTTASAYFSEMAYSQLVMAAQSQAMSAGIPFDLIGEADLTDLELMAQYKALVFPSFRNAPENYADIAATLNQLVYDYDVPIITAGDFMTNAADGDALSANPYERMQTLLGLTRTGGENGVDVNLVATGNHEITAGYGGGAIHTYTGAATSYFSTVAAGTGTVIAQQVVNGTSHDAVISTTTGGRNVHFATEGMLADNNLLGQSIDWVTQSIDGPKVSLSMSRDNAIVASRNDMDQSQETYDVDNGIYDAMMPILDQWKTDYNFVGSYYVNVGLYSPDQDTNWFISSSYYQQLLAMGNEIGSHSYSHPFDTNLLLPDEVTQDILDQRIAGYAAMLDNPSACFCPYCMRDDADQSVIDALAQMSVAQINATLQSALLAPDPMALDPVSKAILEASFKFQFETSRHVIEDNLGIVVGGAAVPGMPESLETARQIIQYYDYLTGGASMVGAGYPGALGYLSPTDTDKVYIAPNMSFDFTLLGWLGLTAEQAAAKWIAEFNDLTINSDLPIVVWPWHDYGVTSWDIEGTGSSPYTLAMFTELLGAAHAAGSEFVTLADLAARIATFEKTELTYAVNGDTITVTATPQSGTLGTFAVNLDSLGSQTISAVTNWYAYDGNSVFLDANGGTYEIKLGLAQADVTHITSIGARMQLITLEGDGVNLAFTMNGEGLVSIDLADMANSQFLVSGAEIVSLVDGIMTLRLVGLGDHSVSLVRMEAQNLAPTDIVLSNLAAVPELLLDRVKVADLLVIDPNFDDSQRQNILTVSDDRFEIDPNDGALYRKAGVAFDFETEPSVALTITATDGELVFAKEISVVVSNSNDAPTGDVTIVGNAVENQTLSANVASLADPDGLGTLNYQWQRDTGTGFVNINGATDATYKLTDEDALALVRVIVSYTDVGGTLESVASSATAAVTDVLPPVALTPLNEDMTRTITSRDLAGTAYTGMAFAVVGLVASSGKLTDNGDGTWLFIPALNDDTDVTFTYSIATADRTDLASATLDLVGMNDVVGSDSADTLPKGSSSDLYHGGAGNDTIQGGGGDDIMFGDAGDDTVYGNAGDDIFVATLDDGNDTYIGGSGSDVLDLSRISADVTVNANSATSTQTGTDSLRSIENIIGGSGNDTIIGSGAANMISGGRGNDVLDGRGGKDVLVGGEGSDVFVFRNIAHSRPDSLGRDVITDFTQGEDVIDLSIIDAAAGVGGNQAFIFLAGAGAAFTGVRGQLSFMFEDIDGTEGDKTIVTADVNGDQIADFSIELSGLIDLTAVDFIL
ncbi:M10 family metallopeptidase C-terminal domain-containing protein [Pelagibacterium sp.]|uniref:M10 family metallopeptidase C-terminal domain-containing protein n=1 Tax=Pelagibacterium sp. TaxID=1967288 RepID=UPI003A8E42E9